MLLTKYSHSIGDKMVTCWYTIINNFISKIVYDGN